MRLRDKLRADINESRRLNHDLAVQDRMRELSRGDFQSYEEAMEDIPPLVLATDADVAASIERWRREPARVRRHVECRGDAWPAYFRERWLAYADAVEHRFADPDAEAGPAPKHPCSWSSRAGLQELRLAAA